jgi:hypothetical protein
MRFWRHGRQNCCITVTPRLRTLSAASEAGNCLFRSSHVLVEAFPHVDPLLAERQQCRLARRRLVSINVGRRDPFWMVMVGDATMSGRQTSSLRSPRKAEFASRSAEYCRSVLDGRTRRLDRQAPDCCHWLQLDYGSKFSHECRVTFGSERLPRGGAHNVKAPESGCRQCSVARTEAVSLIKSNAALTS